jgi:HEPN domain-containing protein
MKDETREWLRYAAENQTSASLLLAHGLYNPCLQNAQQAVEKLLKALLVESAGQVKKTHSISDLKGLLLTEGIDTDLTADECEFLDTIYLPSKYPLGSALPDYDPGQESCARALDMVQRVADFVDRRLKA